MTHKKSNPHEILGVSPTANIEEIDSAYKKLVKLHHPDLHQDEAKKKESEEMMKKVNVAYDEITNPKPQAQRQSYSEFGNINDFINNVFGRAGGHSNNFNFNFTQTISADLSISITKAVLGGEVECESPIGKLKLNLPPATQPGSVFNIQVKKDNNSTIIIQVRVTVVIPSNLTDEQKKKLEELNI